MSALIELAERCEKASGPDAEADYLIHAHVMGWRTPDELNRFSWCVGENYQFGHPDDERRAIYIGESELPNYTASLDAAMSLVPEGWNIQFERTGKASRACVWRAARNYSRYATTPALALCAAALRARADQ